VLVDTRHIDSRMMLLLIMMILLDIFPMFAFMYNINPIRMFHAVHGFVKMFNSDDGDDDDDDDIQGVGMVDHFLFAVFVTSLIIVYFGQQ